MEIDKITQGVLNVIDSVTMASPFVMETVNILR